MSHCVQLNINYIFNLCKDFRYRLHETKMVQVEVICLTDICNLEILPVMKVCFSCCIYNHSFIEAAMGRTVKCGDVYF